MDIGRNHRLNRLSVLILLILTLYASPSVADTQLNGISALVMREWCTGLEQARHTAGGDLIIDKGAFPDADKCYGAFLAIQQAGNMVLEGQKQPTLGSCPPSNSSLTQLVKVFDHYVDTHPEQGNLPFVALTVTAFYHAWPCPGDEPPKNSN